MSRNDSYPGSHTVINRGSGWFSGDNNRSTPETRLAEARQAFLTTVLIAYVNNRPLPTRYPKAYAEQFAREIDTAGGVLNWAKRQSRYARILKNVRKFSLGR